MATNSTTRRAAADKERTRRRAKQADNAAKAEAEIKTLTSPSTPEKEEAIARAKAEQERKAEARTSVRKEAQAEHAAQAAAELYAVSATPEAAAPRLVPGEQLDHVSVRQFMRQQNRGLHQGNRTAATAAGRAVLGVLDGRAQGQTRFRKQARQEAAIAASKQKQD